VDTSLEFALVKVHVEVKICKTMILQFVLYRREEHILRVFENRIVRRIYCNVLGGSIHDGTLLHSKRSIHYS
jgi:hypothetical protein